MSHIYAHVFVSSRSGRVDADDRTKGAGDRCALRALVSARHAHGPASTIVRVALHVHRNGLSHTWDMAPT